MGSINDYSDEDFLELVKELNIQENYLDKVKFFYGKNDRYKGEKRTIMNIEYSFSLLPQTQEEKLIWWEYFVEQRALEYCKVWMDKNASEMDIVDDRNRTIEVLLKDIQDEVNGKKDRIRGYNYGIKKTGLDSLNLESFNVDSFMSEIGKGLGLYYAELKLKKLQEESKEVEIKEDFPNLELLTNRQKLTLAKELGVISHLRNEFNWVSHKKSNLGNLLCLLFGINLNSKDADDIKKDITKMDSGDPTRSPINSKNIEAIHKQLHVLGFNPKDLEKVRK